MKQINFLLVLTFVVTRLVSQTVSFEGIRDPYLEGIKPIMDNGVVNGYSLFVFLDKSDRKNYNYQIRIFDANLKEKYTLDLTKSSDYNLVETSYNNSHLGFLFIDLKNDILEEIIVNGEGKISGTYKSEELTRREKALIMEKVNKQGNPYTISLIGVPDSGFVAFNADTERGWNSKITMISNAGKKKWQINANDTKEKDYAFAFPLQASAERLISLVMVRDGLLSQKLKENYILINDMTTGKLISKISNSGKKYEYSAAGASYEPISGDFFVFGEYFDAKKNVIKDKSKGIYVSRYTKNGKLLVESFNSWEKELKNSLGLNDKGKMDENMTLAVMELVQMNDGKFFAVCEQFKKTADAGGIAINVLTSAMGGGMGAAMAKAVKGDLVILEFDSAFHLIKSHKFDKEKSDVLLMPGAEYMSTAFVGAYIKYTGEFDFKKITKSPDNNNFNVLYINWDREKGEKNNYVIGNVSYNNKQLVQDKIRLSTKPTKYTALPGKPGFTLIYEYYKKEKRITLRMEKIKT